ncbi:hypothetical protein [Xanthobacter sp. KR7-65]|uniref:hypothetical protein n=1 Tax=Xanthobacter sp. KR7-65 TaxID=3156612 RepID=UPI0032B4D6FB
MTERPAVDRPVLAGPEGEGVRLRCDLCGSRRVSVRNFESLFEAVAFVNGRGSSAAR